MTSLTDVEVEWITRLIGMIVDKTLKDGEDGDKVFKLVVGALNRVLKLAQKQGFEAKYEISELCTRAWLAWHAYEKEKNPELLSELKSIATSLITATGGDPQKLEDLEKLG